MLQISPSTYINPFLLDAVLSLGDGEDTLYTSTEGKLHREGPSPTQLASAGFLQFGSLFINKLRISRIITANDTLTTMSGYIFKLPGVNWASVATQLSYKETRSYGYEVPGLQYVYTSTQPSNTSGLPPELTGEGGSSGAFEMQFLGLYPNDLPTITATDWDVVQTTLTPTVIGAQTFYDSLSYIANVSAGSVGVTQPTSATTHYSLIAVHSTDISPTQVKEFLYYNIPPTTGGLITILTYDTITAVQRRVDGVTISSEFVSPVTNFSLVDGVITLDSQEPTIQPTSNSLTVTVLHIAIANSPLPYTYTANAQKHGNPLTDGYYISAGTNSYSGTTFYDGEAVIFVEGQNPLVLQDFAVRTIAGTSLLSRFISEGSAILGLVNIIPNTTGWYINYDAIGAIPPGCIIRVESDLTSDFFEAPLGLEVNFITNQLVYKLICNYIGSTDSTLLNAPPGWHTTLVATPKIMSSSGSSNVALYPSRSNMHIVQSVGGYLGLSFIAEGDIGINSYMKGTIIVIGFDSADTYISFANISGNAPYPSGVRGSSNYIIFEYQYIAGVPYILQAIPKISNSMPVVFEKSTAGLAGPDWWETTELGPDISHITITNITNTYGNLIIDFGNSLKHKPRELTFIMSGNDMNGDLIIAASDGNVTFTAPLAGSVHKLFLGGPVGISSL